MLKLPVRGSRKPKTKPHGRRSPYVWLGVAVVVGTSVALVVGLQSLPTKTKTGGPTPVVRPQALNVKTGSSGNATLLPVIMMHGVGDNHNEFDQITRWLKAEDPAVLNFSAPICDDSASYANLWDQSAELAQYIRQCKAANADAFAEGFTLLCHSQGALTCRTTVELMDDLTAGEVTLISMAGPHRGQFGIPGKWQDKLPWGRDLGYTMMLTGLFVETFQDDLSIANFWNDPRSTAGIWGKPASDYLNGNTFLPVLNNNPGRATQGPSKRPDAAEAARYKANFLKLKYALFLGSPVDDTIIPWDSSVWSFYNPDASATIPVEQTAMWSEDWLGLAELNATGRLELTVVENMCHTCWTRYESVFKQFILPKMARPGGS